MSSPPPSDPLQAFRPARRPLAIAGAPFGSVLQLSEFSSGPNHGLTAPHPAEHSYLVQLRLAECERCDYFIDGRYVERKGKRVGALEVHDLLTLPRADIRDPFHTMYLHVPRSALADASAELGAHSRGELKVAPGAVIEDPTARALFLALRPALASALGRNRLFADHALQALLLHLAGRYGGHDARPAQAGRLARWQEERLRELIDSSLHDALSLADLASAAGLSARQLTRAFSASFGMPPYRYLMQRRIARAQDLLRHTRLSGLNVAMACGFGSQSHFSRVFRACTGVTPAEWRRHNSKATMREED